MTPADRRREPDPGPGDHPRAETRMLTCRDVIALLLDYLEERLSPDVVAEFERHLQGCPACLAYLRTYRRTRQLTGEVTRVEMPEELKDRLRALLLDRLGPGPS